MVTRDRWLKIESGQRRIRRGRPSAGPRGRSPRVAPTEPPPAFGRPGRPRAGPYECGRTAPGSIFIAALRKLGSMRPIDESEIEPLALGAWILGTGGGGSPYKNYLNVRKLYREGKRCRLMDPMELADDDRVVVVSN